MFINTDVLIRVLPVRSIENIDRWSLTDWLTGQIQ
jgi:hypothetical protein